MKLVVVCGFVLLLVAFAHAAESKIKETLLYNLLYNGIPAADAQIQTTACDSSAVLLSWRVVTGPFFSLLFPVDNLYSSVWDDSLQQLLKTEKVIKQRNIKDNLLIHYDFNQNIAISNKDKQWPVPPATQNMMSMLYNVRNQQLHPGDSLSFIVDVETQLWHLQGTVAGDSLFSFAEEEIPLNLVHMYFAPIDSIQTRPWKTDLLTNNIAGEEAELLIGLGPFPFNIPYFILFLHGEKRVEMHLIK